MFFNPLHAESVWRKQYWFAFLYRTSTLEQWCPYVSISSKTKTFLCCISQCHVSWWWPGDARSQVTSSYDFDSLCSKYSVAFVGSVNYEIMLNSLWFTRYYSDDLLAWMVLLGCLISVNFSINFYCHLLKKMFAVILVSGVLIEIKMLELRKCSWL